MIRLIALMLISVVAQSATIDLTCDKPTKREDGSAITNLTGYRIYHSINGVVKPVIAIPATTCGYKLIDALPGKYEFAISSVEGTLEGKRSAMVTVDVVSSPPPPVVTKIVITQCYSPTNCVTQEITQ
jgi:hypothetical protein